MTLAEVFAELSTKEFKDDEIIDKDGQNSFLNYYLSDDNNCDPDMEEVNQEDQSSKDERS